MAVTVPLRRLVVAGFIGTAIEFYDFFAYGIAAALVMNREFFPELDPLAGTLAAFSTYAVAFASRPLGAIVFGHLGDRLGRKRTLVASLLLMGLSTVAVGLLPGYAAIVVLAPVALVVLRFLQGVGLGGEWGGAVLLSVEHAPAGKRGRYALFPQLGPPAGFIAANAAFLLTGLLLPGADWAWRLPFLFSAALVAVGLYVRGRVPETPDFRAAAARGELTGVPLMSVLRGARRELLLGAGAMTVQYALFYSATAYALSYGVTVLGVPQGEMLLYGLLSVPAMAVGTWWSAVAGDRYGRRRLVVWCSALAVVWGLVMFPMMAAGRVLPALAVALLIVGVGYGPMGALLPELFGARHRYTGAALAYSLGGVLGGALPPLLASGLQARYGPWAVGAYLSAVALIGLLCAVALRPAAPLLQPD